MADLRPGTGSGGRVLTKKGVLKTTMKMPMGTITVVLEDVE